MINESAKTWNIFQYIAMCKNGGITFSNIYQRSYVWDKERECNLLASLIEGYKFPAVTASKHAAVDKKDKNQYDLLNGKQRLTALLKIYDGEVVMEDVRRLTISPDDFATLITLGITDEELAKIKYINVDGEDTIDINGFTYPDLPEAIRKMVEGRMIRIEYYDSLTKKEERQMIINLNSGKGMSAIERTRIEMASFETVMRLAKHPVFREALSESAFNRYVNEDIVSKMWVTLFTEDPSLETKVIRPLMREAEITNEQEKKIMSVLDRIMSLAELIREDSPKVAKQRILGRTHIVSMAPCILRSIEENVELDTMKRWLEYFYSGTARASISDIYNDNATKNSAQKQSVFKRLTELKKSYEEFVVDGKEIPVVDFSAKRKQKKSESEELADKAADEDTETVNEGAEANDSNSVEVETPEETMETIKVDFMAGESRENNRAVNYMVATVGDLELYAEVEIPEQQEESGTYGYDSLKAEIISQAEKNQIPAERLEFAS